MGAAVKITESLLKSLEPGRRLTDTEVRGLFALAGPRGVVWKFQRDLHRGGGKVETIRRSLGNWPKLSLREARKIAREYRLLIERKIIPPKNSEALPVEPAAPGAVTLATAYASYLKHAASERTRRDLEYRFDHYFGGTKLGTKDDPQGRKVKKGLLLPDEIAPEMRDHWRAIERDWHELPITEITGEMCRERHEALKQVAGAHSANRSLKDLKAVLTEAQVEPNPVGDISRRQWKAAKEAGESRSIALSELPQWYARLKALEDWRQRLHLLNLLSGARPAMIVGLERAWVDLPGKCIRFPAEQVKTREPFRMPISAWMAEILTEALGWGRLSFGETPWVFPLKSRGGKIGPMRFWREKRMAHPESHIQEVGYCLRHTYASVSIATPGVSYAMREHLMARRLTNTAGRAYDHAGALFAEMAAAQELISAEFARRLGVAR